jgi:outer membrane receptor for ferrienterochelin and colicins
MNLFKHTGIFLFCFIIQQLQAQNSTISGFVRSNGQVIEIATVTIEKLAKGSITDITGFYSIDKVPSGSFKVIASMIGYKSESKTITIGQNEHIDLSFELSENENALSEVVITGTLKEVVRSESPVPVEVYKPTFFRKNPTPNIYDAMQNINGIRPQLNCQVCNTGDIHINGLEGPYTMVLIDGMPIVSSLSTVYGLMGIPNSLVERIEIVKGPASSLYGSEAVGGLINIITKNPTNASTLAVDVMATTYGEYNIDLGLKSKISKSTSVLTGLNYFNYQNTIDRNNDNFTDMTLQNRISVFQKYNFNRKDKKLATLAARYLYEDRWGGQVDWNKSFRGGNIKYGESIYTDRWELLGNYQLPVKPKILLNLSYNDHHQNSYYGTTSYFADQRIAFGQLTWDTRKGRHDLLLGTAYRYIFYDDNTPATASQDSSSSINNPLRTYLPGVFLQDEITISKVHKLLLGMRYDHNSFHGNIWTPRLAYKWSITPRDILRLNAGTGFRVVNLFTEDHAALTGARVVEIKSNLNPEKSYNVNLNYLKKIYTDLGGAINYELSAWYTYFENRIIADYESDPNKIIYDNLSGFAQSYGLTANVDIDMANGWKYNIGMTYMENPITDGDVTEQQILTEKVTGTWGLTYAFSKFGLSFDYTGNIYSPMRLPVLGELDPREPESPWWSIQNIQVTKRSKKGWEIYGGIKNFLNWTPNRNNAFIIARAHDPFDKDVEFGPDGNVLVTDKNPYGLTFDPSYVYAPNQGIRGFVGFRYNFD